MCCRFKTHKFNLTYFVWLNSRVCTDCSTATTVVLKSLSTFMKNVWKIENEREMREIWETSNLNTNSNYIHWISYLIMLNCVFLTSMFTNIYAVKNTALALYNINRILVSECWCGCDALLCLQDVTCLDVGGQHWCWPPYNHNNQVFSPLLWIMVLLCAVTT